MRKHAKVIVNVNKYLNIKLARKTIEGLTVEWHWREKNVDLAMLTERIGNFFKERNFEAINVKTQNGYEILAENSPHFKLLGYVSAVIEGEPDDFVVKLSLCGENVKHSLIPHFKLLTMFGGGYLLLEEFKSDEAWIRLKSEFKQSLENAVLQLTNSANY